MYFQEIYYWAGLRYHSSFALIFALNIVVGTCFVILLALFLRFIAFLLDRYLVPKDTYSMIEDEEQDEAPFVRQNDSSVSQQADDKSKWALSKGVQLFICILYTVSSVLFIFSIFIISVIPAVFYGLHILAIGSTIFAILFYYALVILLLGIRWSRRRKIKVDDAEGHININRTNRIRLLMQTHKVTFGLLCALAVVFSFAIPLALRDSCICIFSKDHGISILNGTAVFSTNLIRSFTVEKQCKEGAPCHVYATLPSNTSSSVFINVHTHIDVDAVKIEYDTLENYEKTGKLLFSADSYTYKLDIEERGKRAVHTALLKELEAHTVYYYQVVYDNQAYYNSTYRTLPKEGAHEPVLMVLGGDVGSSDIGVSVTASLEKVGVPDILVVGGDAAYDDGLQACYYSWDLYLDGFEHFNQVVNRTIPFIISVGNHDIGFNSMSKATVDENELPLYYIFIPQHYKIDEKTGKYLMEVPAIDERKTVFYHLVGNTLQLSLDSGYVAEYEDQNKWMKELLPQYPTFAKFANYHVPIYPAVIKSSIILSKVEKSQKRIS